MSDVSIIEPKIICAINVHRMHDKFQVQNCAQSCAGSRNLQVQACLQSAFKLSVVRAEFEFAAERSERASVVPIRRQPQNHQGHMEPQDMGARNASLVDS